jgi:hypothetical protein
LLVNSVIYLFVGKIILVLQKLLKKTEVEGMLQIFC